MRKIGRIAVAALAAAGALAVAGPAAAEPSQCGTRTSDSGGGGDWDAGVHPNGRYLSYIYGTWYNCGGSGTDRVRVRIDYAPDGPCLSVPARSALSWSTTLQYPGLEMRPRYAGWYRC
ncbi:hypothetical protein ACIBG7_24055 [Nonomuraea sp. NPDC050328]|uniref:hypothetical protein n=1 Tax=Nonomuraea sp. NPDC050328 TaxID=3364361 RepID=UPI0037A08F7C